MSRWDVRMEKKGFTHSEDKMFVREKDGSFVSYTIPDSDKLPKAVRRQIAEVVKMYPQTQFFRGDIYDEPSWKTPDNPKYDGSAPAFLMVTLPLDVSRFLFPKILKKEHTPEQALLFPKFFRKIEGVLHLTVRTFVSLELHNLFAWEDGLWESIWQIPPEHTLNRLKRTWRELCLVQLNRIEPLEWMLTHRCVPRLVVESLLADMMHADRYRFEKFLRSINQTLHSFYNALGKPEKYKKESEEFMKLYTDVLRAWNRNNP